MVKDFQQTFSSTNKMSVQELFIIHGPRAPVGQDFINLRTPSFQLECPRVQHTFDKKVLPDKANVYHVAPTGMYRDIYHFMMASRTTKLKTTFYLFVDEGRIGSLTHDIVRRDSVRPYNIVSGDKIPSNLSRTDKLLIKRYLTEGLHILYTLNKAKFNETEIRDVKKFSLGKCEVPLEESWVMSISNLFTALVIDYYQISSDISGVDAQYSFMTDPEYRLCVYNYIEMVFRSLVNSNSQPRDANGSFDDLLRNVATILNTSPSLNA